MVDVDYMKRLLNPQSSTTPTFLGLALDFKLSLKQNQLLALNLEEFSYIDMLGTPGSLIEAGEEGSSPVHTTNLIMTRQDILVHQMPAQSP